MLPTGRTARRPVWAQALRRQHDRRVFPSSRWRSWTAHSFRGLSAAFVVGGLREESPVRPKRSAITSSSSGTARSAASHQTQHAVAASRATVTQSSVRVRYEASGPARTFGELASIRVASRPARARTGTDPGRRRPGRTLIPQDRTGCTSPAARLPAPPAPRVPSRADPVQRIWLE